MKHNIIRISPSSLIATFATSAVILIMQTHPIYSNTPAWTPNSALVIKLADVDIMQECALKPPKGLLFRDVSDNNNKDNQHRKSYSYQWLRKGAKNTVSGIDLYVADASPSLNAEEVISEWVDNLKSHIFEITLSPIESGTIHNTPFSRLYFKGFDSSNGKTVHGLIYASVQYGKMVRVSSMDYEPRYKSTLAINEASIQTLIIKPPVEKKHNIEGTEWQPDKKLSEKLDTANYISDYTICPPKGYKASTQASPNSPTLTYTWIGTSPGSPSQPGFAIQITPIDSAQKVDVEKECNNVLNGISKQMYVSAEPIENGSINGLYAYRQRYKATSHSNNRQMEIIGYLYALVDDSHLLLVVATVSNRDEDDILPLLETSIRTIKAR